MKPDGSKQVVIVAGPNGAGKTTFAEEFLPKEAHCIDFINADLIARGLSPFAPEKATIEAGKIMLAQMTARIRAGKNFAFETTLSGTTYVSRIRHWQAKNYYVKLVFLSLPSVDLALARVRARVALGGHNIPEDVVRRRFVRGKANFDRIYKSIVNGWTLYDNAGKAPVLIDTGENA